VGDPGQFGLDRAARILFLLCELVSSRPGTSSRRSSLNFVQFTDVERSPASACLRLGMSHCGHSGECLVNTLIVVIVMPVFGLAGLRDFGSFSAIGD
jgi:hypothetical protein